MFKVAMNTVLERKGSRGLDFQLLDPTLNVYNPQIQTILYDRKSGSFPV